MSQQISTYKACRELFPEKKYESFEQCVNERQIEKTLFIAELECKEYFPTIETKKYYKCILKNMKGVSTDIAARAIINQCKEKYLKD